MRRTMRHERARAGRRTSDLAIILYSDYILLVACLTASVAPGRRFGLRGFGGWAFGPRRGVATPWRVRSALRILLASAHAPLPLQP